MAVISVKSTDKVAIRVESGIDSNGKKVYKDVIFNNINTNAKLDAIYATCEAIKDVLSQTAEGYYLISRYSLVTE